MSREAQKKRSHFSNDRDSRNTHKSSKVSIKKEKIAYHKEKYKREGRQFPNSNTAKVTAKIKTDNRSDEKTVDIHQASKIAQDLRRDISNFKQRHANDELLRCADIQPFFSVVPPSFISQHIPADLKGFLSYLPKFSKGAPTPVNGYLQWYEWACYEKNKGNKFGTDQKKVVKEESGAEEGESSANHSEARRSLAKTYREREHVRSLLMMCLRHNSEQRKAGQHAFINYLNNKLVEDDADCRNLETLKATVHHSVAYALSRLVLGMAEENLSTILLNFHALYLVLTKTQVTPAVILAVINEELSLEERIKACRMRVSKRTESDNGPDDLDPDDIADPTKGERNQRMVAAVFALAAVVLSKKMLSSSDGSRLSNYLSFCYVEQKATRVMSATMLFLLLQREEMIWKDEEAFQWLVFAFFSYPKLEYFRPEAIQFLLLLMNKESLPTHLLPSTVVTYLKMDPLEPSNLEQMCTALFRKEQVTSVHPMIHPVWNDLINLILSRCEAGESLKSHFSTFVHTVIVPYRRGNADLPRRSLFQQLVSRMGQIAVRHSDAKERLELLHMASKNAGYGRSTAAKPSSPEELKQLSPSLISEKVSDLIVQYRSTKDSDPASSTNRRWVLRELRGCLSVSYAYQVDPWYVNQAVLSFLEFGFFPPFKSRDTVNQNRCIYLFADYFSFTYSGSSARVKCSLKGLQIISEYLRAEEKGKTRFTTAVSKSSFRKARNSIVEALENSNKRSVLFYDDRDMEVLLTLLFLTLSIDDPSNSEAKTIASSVIPDLVHFYIHGKIETIDLFYDILMTLIMRVSLPLQVVSIMACVRRIATGFMLRCARYIRSASALDILLAPLREAYNTDNREIIRQKKAAESEGNKEEDESESEGDESDSDADGNIKDEEEVSDDENSSDSDHSSTSEDSADTLHSNNMSDVESQGTQNDEESEEDQEDEGTPEEEAPTQAYIDALKGMIGDVDLEHSYPTDVVYNEKRDAVRAIQLAARVGRSLNTPLVIHIYQVLLAVCRENVKVSDDTIFNAILSAIDLLLLSRNRYFGSFVDATSLFQVLGDIQSYCRKSVKSLYQAGSTTPKMIASIRYRMSKLKTISLRVFHFISFLAAKNHADEGVRVVLSEYYKSIFCDRGWNTSSIISDLKQDIYHYRQGFVWALLPAVFDKFADVVGVDGPQRVRVLCGCCSVIESLLPRLTRLSQELKLLAQEQICTFLQSLSLESVYMMKHTLTYFYVHTIKMVLKYNRRVQLDEKWVEENIVDVAVNNDDIKMTGATIRVISTIERILQLMPRIKETKAPVPMKSLFQSNEGAGRDKKFQSVKRIRSKTLKKFLASKQEQNAFSEGLSAKRRRKEELKMEDRLQRQILREATKKVLSKAEREEKRKRIMVAKQERIAKNKERKRKLHELRQKSFERWRQEKIAQSLSQD